MPLYKDTSLSKDPRIQDLQLQLCDLACVFSSSSNPEKVIKEYGAVVMELYSLGWDGLISLDCVLPSEYMPEEYRRRNPDAVSPIRNESWLHPKKGNSKK